MAASARTSHLGRNVFGAAAIAYGAVALIWHNYKDWDQLRSILTAFDGPAFVFTVAAAWIFGGAAIQFRRTATMGAVVLAAVYLIFVLLTLPALVLKPRVYNPWGNFFEQFSLLTGAALVCARLAPLWSPDTLNRIGRIAFGLCTASFALEQAVYLNSTTLVPRWLPPGQNFWAIATTLCLALAAVSLLINRVALLAIRLLTVMLVSFGVLVWIPLLISHPSYNNGSEAAETFAIAGTAWILADLLSEYHPMVFARR
jgi:hypothetical protein